MLYSVILVQILLLGIIDYKKADFSTRQSNMIIFKLKLFSLKNQIRKLELDFLMIYYLIISFLTWFEH